MDKIIGLTSLVMIGLGILLAPARACDVRIKSVSYNPSIAIAGEPVTVNAQVEYQVDWNDWNWKNGVSHSCEFLIEASIVPRGYANLRIWPLSTIERSHTQCCPGNQNYQAEYETVTCGLKEVTGCSKTVNVTLKPFAPYVGFCDHCAGEYGNINPDCYTNPDFYWDWPGWYVLTVGAYKGCYYDLAERGMSQETYAERVSSIKVKGPTPTPWRPQDGGGRPWYRRGVVGSLTAIDLGMIFAPLIISAGVVLGLRRKKK